MTEHQSRKSIIHPVQPEEAENTIGQSDDDRNGVSRRTFVGGVLGAAGIAMGFQVSGATAQSDARSSASCGLGSTGQSYEATESGIVSDSLGRRYVEAGEFIYPELGCSSEMSTFGTPAQCGVNASPAPYGVVYLGPNWYELVGRYCPFQGSSIEDAFYPNEPIYISQVTYQGTKICRCGVCSASTAWYRTSGSQGLWLWSGGTNRPIWNTSC